MYRCHNKSIQKCLKYVGLDFELISPINARKKLIHEPQFARAPLSARASDCSYLFEISHAIQNLCIRNTKFLVDEAFKMSYLG